MTTAVLDVLNYESNITSRENPTSPSAIPVYDSSSDSDSDSTSGDDALLAENDGGNISGSETGSSTATDSAVNNSGPGQDAATADAAASAHAPSLQPATPRRSARVPSKLNKSPDGTTHAT